jgi:hypothetical protein
MLRANLTSSGPMLGELNKVVFYFHSEPKFHNHHSIYNYFRMMEDERGELTAMLSLISVVSGNTNFGGLLFVSWTMMVKLSVSLRFPVS